jgi:DNA-binding MarR family transcriptional regulator
VKPGDAVTRSDHKRRTDGVTSSSLLFDVYALSQAVRRLLAVAMAPGPLRPEDYAIYSAIFEPEAITPTDLAARLGLPLTTLMDHLARLEARGQVRRAPSPADRRASVVVLTAEGLAAHRAAHALFEAAYQSFVGSLSGGELAARRSLGEIRTAVEQAVAKQGPDEIVVPTTTNSSSQRSTEVTRRGA